MRTLVGTTAVLCALTLAGPVAAQSIRLEGRWTLNRERTALPNMPQITLEIHQTASGVDYRRTAKDSQKEWEMHMKLPADGRETTWTDQNGTRLRRSGVVRDGTFALAFESRQLRGGKWVILSIEDVHTVSEDGKTLSIAHTEAWEGKRGRYPNPLVFDRSAAPSGNLPAFPLGAAYNPAQGVLTRTQVIEDSRQLLNYLEQIHPDPYRYSGGKVAFHRRFQDTLQATPAEGMSREDFFRLWTPFVAAIRDGHTAILPPGAVLAAVTVTAPSSVMPLSFSSIEKCLYVDGVPSQEHAALLGARLLSMEGVPVAAMLERITRLRGVENDEHGLMILGAYLASQRGSRDLLPEWRDPSRIHVQLELPGGTKQEQVLELRLKQAPALVHVESRLTVPTTGRGWFGHQFMSADRKVALLKVDGMRAYREAWESASQGRDVSQEASEDSTKPSTAEEPLPISSAVLAGIPSAVETFRELFGQMKDAKTETLVIDLSQNPGGNDLMADILTYFLAGPQELARIVAAERSTRKLSPSAFGGSSRRSLDALNAQYAQVHSYALTDNDYDFAEDRFKELFLAGKLDLGTAMALKFGDTPTFLAELESGAYAAYYKPKRVLVTASHGTYSAGFTLLRMLYECGATIVGSTSAQAGNGFGDATTVSLRNTGLQMMVSTGANLVFPDQPTSRVQIRPHHELTYEKLKSYGFDPNAVILYALDLAGARQAGRNSGRLPPHDAESRLRASLSTWRMCAGCWERQATS